MKKIAYILSNTLTDIRENIRISIFSMVFVYLCFFYISDVSFINGAVSNLDGLVDTYYLTVQNEAVSYNEVRDGMSEYGEIHYVAHGYSNCKDEYVDCYMYDSYIMEHISYSFQSGEKAKNEDEVILSSAFAELYDVGDEITFSVYREDGSSVTKTKYVSGILKDNIIYYPTGMGSYQMDLLFVNGDDGLFCQKSMILLDKDLMPSDPGVNMMFLIEPKSSFQEKVVEGLVVDWGDFYSGEQIIDNNYEMVKSTKSKNRIIVTAGFSVSLSVFLGSIYISLVRRRKEQAILMLCGGSRLDTSVLLKMNGFCSMLLGVGLGVLFANISKNRGFFEGDFSGIHILGVILLVIIIYCLSCILVELCWKRESIVELMRKSN